MRLLLNSPLVGHRRCADCLKWQYDEKTGQIEKRLGEWVPRVGKPPCGFGAVHCPRGSPDNEITDKNRRAFAHYRLCRAVGVWPADPIVRRNAAIIREIEDAFERKQQLDFFGLLTAKAAIGK